MIIKFIKKKFNLIKICAVFTTVCFVVSTLGANLYAIPLAENANKKYEDVFNKVSSISAEYGKITSSKDAQSDITVINIQDLHCHPQTQRNISKIITQIADKYNLKKIYVEGGYGDIDTSWLNAIKDEKIKRQIIEGLLEEGILTGSEYYKLTNNNEVELKGIDEEQIHKDNVRRLSWIIANQDKYKDVIKKVENEINILEKMHVNSRNERFNRDIEKYLTNEIDSRRFYRQLAKYIRDINESPDKYNNITAIRLEDYPNITKFIALRKTSKDIDVKEVTQQLQMVINELKNKLPYNVYTKLLSETENLSDSQKVVELITMLCNKEGINLENKYKSLHTFLESNGINRELNTVELVQEERQLLSEIRKALSYNNEEYEITFISDFSKYFKDYLEYKLTDADWKYFEKEFDQFITLYSKYATVNRIQEIYGDFEEINKYYKINDQRNNIFVANLLKNEEISVSETDRVRQEEEILKNSKEVIIAVTGGFHSTELEEILAKKEVNTIVITPSIFEGIEKATKQYKGIIKEQSRYFQHQALAYTLASCTTDEYKKNLLYSMAKEFLGGNVERLKEVLGQDVDLTVFDKLQPLTEQEQEQISEQKNIIVSAASNIVADTLPKEGGKAIFVPNVSEIILKVSRSLVDAGIFLNNGPVFAAEELGLPNLDDISPEEYSRMPDSIQEALVAKEYGTEDEFVERASEEENVAEENVDETEDVETLIEEETVDSSYLSEERKSELLKKLNNDKEALDLLIDICCRKSVNFDLSKDSALLEMFIRKLNLGEDYLDFDYMYDIVKRSIHVANTFSIDTDLKFACFEKFIDFFNSEDKNKNGEVYYITLFRRLFSLNKKSLQFFYETLDGLSANDLVFYYDASKINKNLKFLLENFDKGIYEITDYSRLVNLFDNIDKLSFLSEGEFSYLISLPNKIFVSVLYSSTDSFQLKTKLTVGKKYYYKGCDEDVARAIFDKAEKLQGLNVIFYPAFSRLNKEAILFILDNVNNSSEIEKILSLYRGMGLSPEFENTIRLKDFKDPRFKALVKYISSIQDRDFYDKLFFGIYDRENLRNIVNSIDDANFVKDYLLNPDYQKIYKNLFKKLADLNIKNVAAENNHLALKLILNKEFNQILTESGIDNISDEDNIIARYYSAIAVSRMIFDGVGGEKIYYDFNDEAGMELIKEVTDTYLEIMKEMLNVVLLDSDTKIYALCNSERVYGRDRFNIDTLQEIIEYMGIQLEIPGENVYRRVGNNKNASKGWLNAIETFVMDSIRTKGYFMFRGHGNENMLWVYDPKEKDNGLATGDMLEVITPRELAESLFKLATRDQDPVDLRNITIDLSSCYSYYFARSVYNILEQKFKAENKTESYPTIITAAGLETEFGITDFRGMEGNLHKGINKLLRNFQRGSVSALTLGMVGVSEYMFSDSNITMFSSFFDENMLERIAKTRESIAKFNISRHRAVETEPDILDNIEQTATRVNIRNAKKMAIRILPKFVTESSVFRADKTAPLWEELVYRALPTLALTALLIASTMFLPAVPVVAVIAKLTCIGIFSLVQVRFIKAHIVTDWLKAMDAGGPVNLKDVFEDKSLTGREKINKTIEIIKKRILVIFPNSKEERSFYRFYTRNKQAISHREGLIIPTIVFSLPYLAAIIFFNSMPVVAIATVISMALHFINNEVARTLEEKEKLKEKQSSVKFLDIQKRLSHVELLIDNPQMKMDLPEIRVGRLALMFGLETINERRAKNLSDYEKVRDSFINRLEPENLQKQKESIEKELSRIEGKKRKTKKDKEKIAELKEKLEIIEKEYPEIRAELLSADTKKVEKIIDSINSLLPIFEEIEVILEEIESFRDVNGDTEETRELEREFLDFTEQTLMRELMSLYDANVTGLHVRRVVAFSKLIGSNMPFGNNVRMMYNLMLSSILHDIGKNLVPGTILNKQGSFDDLERDIMDFHVVFGGFILRSSILKNLSYTAENHHYTTKNSPRSYSFDSKMGYEHEAADYEEAQIAKIVTLTDVYEAVSPKLSFSTERTYQFPRKIRDISDMLENISAEVDLTEFQKKEVIVLLAEIAQIDSEEDAAKKQEMEQAFIKKVLYNRSRSFVINYVREKNYDFVRANAFKIVFTKSPQEVFKELGKTEEEFMYDFESGPEGAIDKCMSLVSEFEFDTAVVRAFLEFYFSSEDININDEIIESLNKEKESDFIVYMKKLSYSFYKMFRRARFIMVRFAPVIASIFSEEQEGVSVKEKFNIDTVVNYTVVIKRRNGDTHFLYFDERDFQEMGRKNSGVKKGLDSYGIQEIKYDEDGKIVDVILEPGATIDTDASGGEILVGSEAENLSFEDIEEQIKENYERKHHHKLEQEGFLLKPIMEDTGTTEKVDVYLDDDVKTILATIEDAINNNKLMVIHVFKEGFKTQNLSLWQRYQKYKLVYGLLDSRSKFESTFSKSSEIEEQFLKQIEDGLSKEEKEDMEWIKRNAAKTFFALREVLKNNFDHGNLGLFEYPIALHISKDNNGRVTEFSTYNLSTKPITLDRAEEKSLSDLMYEAYISGSHKGAEYMTDSFFTNLEYGDDIKISVGEEVYRIYRTKVTLKTEQEQEQALEKYNQYRQQKAEERRRYEQASEAEKKEIEEQEKKRNLAAFWEDFCSILKPFGVKLGNYAHVWEEVVFRYLPTAFILLGYMNPLVGLGIQIVFILAHPIGKWMAARMNWEKARKEGKQVGKKAGIGDLFKQIGKDLLLLTPTLVLMLPYVGALLSLAINPALSLIITPAIFTFANVIVQWLTRKDSGGISINKNLIIVSVIASLVSYTFLPLIPVIHPIVNTLINPIVITNAINAGYLHYEYNKRQQDRSKSLSIIPRNIDTLSTILSGNVGTKRTTILDLVKNATGEVDVNIVHQLFPDVEIPTIQTIYEDAKNDVQNGTADASQYSGTEKGKEKEREIYFLFVFSESSSSPYFSDDLIHAAYYSIFEQSSNFDVAWKAYSNYKNNSRNKDNADAILKMFSALYAYKTWEDFKKTNPSKMTNGYIELKNGHILKFESWVHVCDGHSVFTNGIETIVKNNIRINSFDYYGNDADAINSVVTLNSLLDSMPSIITDPDMFIFELKNSNENAEPFKIYIKHLDDKIYVYVFLPSDNGEKKLISFYSRKYNGTISFKEALIDRIKERVPITDYNDNVNSFVMAVKAYIADSKPEDKNSEYLLVENFDVNSANLNITAEEPLLSTTEGVDNDLYRIIRKYMKQQTPYDSTLLPKIKSFIQLAKDDLSKTRSIIPFLTLSDRKNTIPLVKQLFNITDELTIKEADNILMQRFGLDSKILISQMISANGEFSFLGEEYTNLLEAVLTEICEVIGDDTIDDNEKTDKVEDILEQFRKDFHKKVYKKIREMKYPYILREINTIIQPQVVEFEEQSEALANDHNDPNLPPADSGDAILPENMGLVNRIMQSKFGNAFVAATVIAFKEFKASMKPSFVDMHQSESGRKGAQQLRDFITRFDVVETDGLAARIIKTILGTIVKGASIVKHIAIDYRYIKASGIQEAISMFGNNTYMDEYGQIHIPPVLIVNDLTGLKDLKNTGIKVNGRYIYQVGQKGILIYGAEGVNSEDISMAVNESQMIKDAIEQMIKEKGYDGVSVEVDGVIQEEGEGVRFDKGITIIGTEELQNKSADYIDGYVSSSIELKRTVGIMYSQKALISLESIDDAEKLKQALYQGRARKIMSKSQYEQLNLTQEEIMALRKNGIEIYVDSNEINMDLKAMGIVGQIVRKNDGQILIHDYYAQEEIEVEEISEEDTLINIEDKLVNSSKPVMIDIKVLAKTFQKENILTAYKGLNNLIGNLKLKTGIGELNKADIMSLIYNLDYNKLPLLSMLDESKSLQEYKENEIEEFLNTAISSMDTNTEIKIILKAIKKNKNFSEEDYNEFVQIIKERILAKTALTKNYKEFGLRDKKLEILLGEMLYKQLPFAIEDKDLSNYNNVDITYINERNERVDVQGENGLMEKIKQDTEKAMRNNDRVAINSIIDIILTYGDSYKDKQLARQLDANDARNYRAMMAAA